ncbi:hypothetical protein K0T92_10745 [Paenibacillus oenotherae]|uniref:Uncharacterized protein n=1 Tax=Paenibacillus oenotherae TaxID=1435645 RepID=A0ABS7D5V4_9BACL|nr:hypothetical protein [Paenibacillus oenotherae]MBW7475224.1 hypothetical protein [Paenibacillus oenotherae]
MQKKAVFKEDEVKRLQRKIKGISEDTNRLRQQINGQVSGWSGDLPVSSMVQQAQRRINQLTDDAEGLVDVVSQALQETTRVQQIIGQGTEKLLRTIGSINPLLGQSLQRSITAHTTFTASFGKKIHHLVTKVIDMLPRDRINSDPVIQKLRAELRQPNLPHPYRIMAEGKLEAILADRELIARMQTAYEVYKKFGNTALMKEAHEQAEKSRQRLRDAGISEELYGAAEDLRRYFPGSEIEACPYDPVTGVLYGSENDRIAMSEDPQYLYLLTLAMQEGDKEAYGIKRLKQYLQATNQILPPEFSYDSRGNKIPNYTYNSRGEKIPIPDTGGSTARQILVNNPDINAAMNHLNSLYNLSREEATDILYALYLTKREWDSNVAAEDIGKDGAVLEEVDLDQLADRYRYIRQVHNHKFEEGFITQIYGTGIQRGQYLIQEDMKVIDMMQQFDISEYSEAMQRSENFDMAMASGPISIVPGLRGMSPIGGRMGSGRSSVKVPVGNINAAQIESKFTIQNKTTQLQLKGLETKGYKPQPGERTATKKEWKALDGETRIRSNLAQSSPISIPSTAAIKVQTKTGYQQIQFKWSDGYYKYELRWHTRTPGAPINQGNTWVIERTTPGNTTGQSRTYHIYTGGNQWTPRHEWQAAITARQNGTATAAQNKMLENGHWPAP